MTKGEKIQKLVLFAAMSVGALLIAEGYLRVRGFVDRVDAAGRQIAVLKQEVDFLRVQLDVAPRLGVYQPPVLAAAPSTQQQFVLPIPEPMRFSPAAQERLPKMARVKDAPALTSSESPAKADAVPDDGRVVLMKDAKEPKVAAAPAQQAVAMPAVDVKLWPKK